VRRVPFLLAVACLAAASLTCRDDSPDVGPSPDAGLLGGVVGGLVGCEAPQPDSAVESIGPEGGTITVGPHALRIPPGALASRVTIAGRVVADTVAAVAFEPQGLTFAEPVFLTLSYGDCGVLRSLLPKRVAFTGPDLVILDYLRSWDNVLAKSVTGRLDHFSTYAVAW
jgi:hypothetical protein